MIIHLKEVLITKYNIKEHKIVPLLLYLHHIVTLAKMYSENFSNTMYNNYNNKV